MKKMICAALFMLLGVYSGYAQYRYYPEKVVDFRVGAYGGYNFAGETPNAGAFFSVSGYHLIAEIDVGWNKMDAPGENFFYASPAVGGIFGDKYRFYCMIGITNWGAYDGLDEEFKTDKIYGKLKIGFDISLTDNFFLTANWTYVANDDDTHRPPYHGGPRNEDDWNRCKSNGVTVGLGFRF